MNIKERLLDFATQIIVERAKKSSLQERVVDMIVKKDKVEITWLNKDKSYFTFIIRANKDLKTKDQATMEFACINYTEEEYKQI